jgi:hypothetical protein
MRTPSAVLFTAILLSTLLGAPQPAPAETSVTVGAGGIYPDGTTFNGVPINGLQSGYGLQIADNGSALGQFCTILVGVSELGLEQNIIIMGQATSGSRTAANASTFSGTCTVDMGDGTGPLLGLPFTAVITTDANDQGSIGLTIGDTKLPDAVVNSGSMTIKTP